MTPEDALTQLQPFLNIAAGAIFSAVAVFARVGAILFMLPGIGERFTPMPVRLAAAIAFSLIAWPMILPQAQVLDGTVNSFGLALLAEVAVGLLIGFSVRMLIYALQTAGQLAAQNLSITQIFGAGVAPDPEPTIGTMLTMGGIALAVTLGLHVQAAALIVDSYELLPLGRFPVGADAAAWSSERVADAFNLAVSLTLPFLVVGFLYNLALGFINRAMPQLPVAFVGMPALVWVGIVVLGAICIPLLLFWHERLQEALAAPLGI